MKIPPGVRGWIKSFLGGRPIGVLWLFVALGMTNLAKGVLFGAGMAGIPMAGYLLMRRDRARLRPYFWMWGWLVFAGLAAAWPIAVSFRHPEAWRVWFTDLAGRLSGTYQPSVEPIWYYPQNLLWMLAPWTPAAILGLAITARTARNEKRSPERFLWCWAIMVPAVFSIPQGKNHHYLLHALAPWAILGSLGLVRLKEWFRTWPGFLCNPWSNTILFAPVVVLPIWLFRDSLIGPGWLPMMLVLAVPAVWWIWTWGVQHPSPRVSGAVIFLIVGAFYVGIHFLAGRFADKHRFDVAFLKTVESECTEDIPLLVDLDVEALRAFLCLFYLPEDARPLHNLSFLNDDRIASGEVYLLTRQKKLEDVPEILRWRLIGQSEKTGGESSPGDRLSLFRCTLDPNRDRLSAGEVRISPMQAMFREPGPVLR